MLALLIGCALRRQELATLAVEDIQTRENRWVIADLRGKGNRIRTVAVPLWVKNGLNAWQTAAGIEEGRLFRSVRKGGKVGESPERLGGLGRRDRSRKGDRDRELRGA